MYTTIEEMEQDFLDGNLGNLANFMCHAACEFFDGISDCTCLEWFVANDYFETTEEALEYYDHN
jgi:hypothetical protein